MSYSIYICNIPRSRGIGNREMPEPMTWDDYIAYEEEGSPLGERPDDEDPYQTITLPDAPSFPGDPTGRTNCRAPSYSGWANFCDATGLQDFFFNKKHGLMREHPGWFPFGPEHLRIVKKTRAAYAKRVPGSVVPGWGDDEERDGGPFTVEGGNLARLLWLEWWMEYALKNFEYPGIANS